MPNIWANLAEQAAGEKGQISDSDLVRLGLAAAQNQEREVPEDGDLSLYEQWVKKALANPPKLTR